VAGTNNGRAPQLAGYYAYWEQAVFNALAVMLLRALERLHGMLGPAAKQPLFRVRRSSMPSLLVDLGWPLQQMA
jgi:dynein heavy chain, axonemal